MIKGLLRNLGGERQPDARKLEDSNETFGWDAGRRNSERFDLL